MPAPPPESEPAIIKTRPCIARLLCGFGPRILIIGSGDADRVTDLVDNRGDQLRVFAFRHHPDHRLGSRSADHEAAIRTEPGFPTRYRALDRGRCERIALTKPDTARQLRHRDEQPADLARSLAGFDDRGQHLQRGDEAVTGRSVVRQDYVAGLLTTEVAAECTHFFDDIAVADPGTVKPDAFSDEKALETEIGHDCRYQRPTCQPAGFGKTGGYQCHQLITVENDSTLVGDDQPIGVTIECDADVCAARQDLALHLLRRQRAAFTINVEAVGRDAEREHLGTELPEYGWSDFVCCSVGAIDDNTQPVQAQPAREALFDELDVTPAGVFEPLDTPQLGGTGAAPRPLIETGFDLLLELV